MASYLQLFMAEVAIFLSGDEEMRAELLLPLGVDAAGYDTSVHPTASSTTHASRLQSEAKVTSDGYSSTSLRDSGPSLRSSLNVMPLRLPTIHYAEIVSEIRMMP